MFLNDSNSTNFNVNEYAEENYITALVQNLRLDLFIMVKVITGQNLLAPHFINLTNTK